MVDYEEYEVIPTSPIRKIEQRLSRVETESSTSEIRKLIEQIIELVKSNQRIIDDIVKSDAELRNEVSKLPGKIDDLLTNMREFMELLKTSATEETVSDISRDVMEPISSSLKELIEQGKKNTELQQSSNTNLAMMDKRLKRIYLQLSAGRHQ